MIQLVSPPQALVQLVIPQLLCFSVYNEQNTSKQLEDWIEEIHRLYHVQELTRPADPISILQAQVEHISHSRSQLEDGKNKLQSQLQRANAKNQKLQKELLQLQNNITTIISGLEEEVDEVVKQLPPETADILVEYVTLYLDHKNCQTAVKDGHKEINDLTERDSQLKEQTNSTKSQEENLKELLKTKNRELEDAKKELKSLKDELDSISELLTLKPEERDQLLLNATHEGNLTSVRALLELGANLSVRDILGNTPLLHAAYLGHTEIAKLLIEAGAGLEDKDEFGNTPLITAALTSQFEICQLLLDHGADVNAKSTTGGTALHLAAFYGDLQITKLLVERGADVNVIDLNGRTPLEDAEANGKLDVVDHLSKQTT